MSRRWFVGLVFASSVLTWIVLRQFEFAREGVFGYLINISFGFAVLAFVGLFFAKDEDFEQ